jgi:hypothetical protein
MHRIGTLSIVVLVLALASCGGSDSKSPEGARSSTVPSAPGPTGTSGSTSADRSSTRSKPDETPPPTPGAESDFDLSSVKVSFLEKSFFGAKSQVVYFVATRAGGTPLAQAQACVGRYVRKAPSAYCYAFASERALRFSHVSRRPPAKMARPCWVAYWGKPKDRRAIGSGTNSAALALHCPGATG